MTNFCCKLYSADKFYEALAFIHKIRGADTVLSIDKHIIIIAINKHNNCVVAHSAAILKIDSCRSLAQESRINGENSGVRETNSIVIFYLSYFLFRLKL